MSATTTMPALRSAPTASASGRGGGGRSVTAAPAPATRPRAGRIAVHARRTSLQALAAAPSSPGTPAADVHASSTPTTTTPAPRWPLTALAALAATLALATTSPPPALADLPTATLDEATAAARPLPQQPVRTGRVWALIGLGAAGVFGAAVAVENNAAWFPAIAKANRAMAATKARAAAEEVSARSEATGGMTDAVAAGIAEASRRAREEAEQGGGAGKTE